MVRVVTLNIWQDQGPWRERLALCAEELGRLAPDVACLQEVREKGETVPNQAQGLAATLGLHVTYERGESWGGGDEGVAILSRFPIVTRDVCELPTLEGRERRVCLAAELESEAGRFWVFTTHLAWRLADGALRERQVVEVDRFVAAHCSPAAKILTGDLNATPESDEIRFLRGLTTLEGRRTYYQDAFASCNPGAAGLTWCRENPYTAALGWLEPDRRLDYVLVSPMTRSGAGVIHSARLVCTQPDAKGI